MQQTILEKENTEVIISSKELFGHWQGHRGLTRKVIEAFPEKELFTFSIGGMRPFSELAMEMIKMAGPGVAGVNSGEWKEFGDTAGVPDPTTRAGILELWDKTTEQIDTLWPQIPEKRFQEVEAAFGMYEDAMYGTLFYLMDNEIHHRGQGYVYLRALGIAPPPFWER